MLWISRKSGQQIKINDDITIVIGRVTSGRVSVGIEAPQKDRILRDDAIHTEPLGDCPHPEEKP